MRLITTLAAALALSSTSLAQSPVPISPWETRGCVDDA